MPAYDATRFDPPAPLATVTVRSPTTGVSVDNVAMLIDTGADVTILPRAPIEDLVETAELVGRYQLEGFDGTRSLAPAVRLELQFLGKLFRGQFLIVDGSHGILGRNVINSVSLIMDGPQLIPYGLTSALCSVRTRMRTSSGDGRTGPVCPSFRHTRLRLTTRSADIQARDVPVFR
jgi:hypothetical protein